MAQEPTAAGPRSIRWHLERAAVNLAHWLIVRVHDGDHSLCFKAECRDALDIIHFVRRTFYKKES